MSSRLPELATLSEGQVLAGVPLSQAEAVDLAATGLVSVAPDTAGWQVTAAYAAGTVRRGDLLVCVRPKVGEVQVLTLLARAYGIRGLDVDRERVDLAPDASLSAVLAVLFCHEARTALGGGPIRGYRTEDQTLPVVRGRMRVRDQELRRFGMLLPVEVTVDEWTLDTPENRLIRRAVRALLRLPAVPADVLGTLRRIDRSLVEVTLEPAGSPIPRWTPTRLTTRLHRLLHLAELVLRHTSVEQAAGRSSAHGFVVSMSWLFETLVGQLLQEADSRWRTQATVKLDVGGLLTIKPDLLLGPPEDALAVADTKYKLLDERGKIPNADAYQLVTYCERLGLSAGHLIYASEVQEVPNRVGIMGSDVTLLVHRVDLTQPLVVIEHRLASLGGELSGNARPVQPQTDEIPLPTRVGV